MGTPGGTPITSSATTPTTPGGTPGKPSDAPVVPTTGKSTTIKDVDITLDPKTDSWTEKMTDNWTGTESNTEAWTGTDSWTESWTGTHQWDDNTTVSISFPS